MEQEEKNNRGFIIMDCPKCNGTSRVLTTRISFSNPETIRRRECINCGYRFTTKEKEYKHVTKSRVDEKDSKPKTRS